MQGIIARAFEFARSGECKTLREINIKLSQAGYENAVGHLHGYQFRRQLLKEIKEASINANAR